jgi:hypothetical protein
MARTESMATIRASLAEDHEPEEGQPEAANVGLTPGESPVGTPVSDALPSREGETPDGAAPVKSDQATTGGTTRAILDASRGILRGTGVRLAGLPTPGSIVLPLVVLLVFFALLLPVNGHTRATWLWLVLTGNAHMVGGIETGSGAVPAAPAGTTPVIPLDQTMPVALWSFTGVEGA